MSEIIRTTGADEQLYIWPEQATELALLLGNGLEGEVHFRGNTEKAVEIIRRLLQSTGACKRVEGREETYLQPPSTPVYLDPIPTGELLERSPRRLDSESLLKHWQQPLSQLEVHEVNRSWAIGSLEIPKTALLPHTLTSPPTYRRGCLTYPLEEDMRFLTLPCQDNIALILRGRWADHFGAWAPLSRQCDLNKLAATLNEEIEEAWRRYRLFLGSGSPPAQP